MTDLKFIDQVGALTLIPVPEEGYTVVLFQYRKDLCVYFFPGHVLEFNLKVINFKSLFPLIIPAKSRMKILLTDMDELVNIVRTQGRIKDFHVDRNLNNHNLQIFQFRSYWDHLQGRSTSSRLEEGANLGKNSDL